jgi:acetyl esterase
MTLPSQTAELVALLEARFPAPDFATADEATLRAYLEQSRANTSTPAPVTEAVGAVHDVVTGPLGIAARVYVPVDPVPAGGIALYLHGGGWATGSVEMGDALCRRLANRSGCVVVSSTYRLAPEHPFPAALDDVRAALDWTVAHAAEHGADGSRVALVGTSAGGNLAAATCLRVRDEGGPTIALQVLAYPVLDGSMSSRSYRTNGTGCFLTAAQMAYYWRCYVPDGEQRLHPYASPSFADDLRGLPPAVVVTAEFDPLRDEAETYSQRLTTSHATSRLYRATGQLHSFLAMLGANPAADELTDVIARALREHLAP